jgi:hypothetical protein
MIRYWLPNARLALVGIAMALALSACAGAGTINGQPGLEWQIQRFYADKATEAGGSCTGPLIRSVTAAETIEESENQVVMRVRYYWIDEGMVNDDRVFPYNSALSCRGFAERDFTFAKMADGTLQVIDMSGAKRNVRQNFNTG